MFCNFSLTHSIAPVARVYISLRFMHIIYEWQSASILGRILWPLLAAWLSWMAAGIWWNGIISGQWRQTVDDEWRTTPVAICNVQRATCNLQQLRDSARGDLVFGVSGDCHFSSMASFIMPLAKWQLCLVFLLFLFLLILLFIFGSDRGAASCSPDCISLIFNAHLSNSKPSSSSSFVVNYSPRSPERWNRCRFMYSAS